MEPVHDEDELLRRLPEIRLIDGSLRREVISVFLEHCPEYFWTKPASANYHQVEHREKHGLWYHTKRAFTVYEELAPSFVAQGLISEAERNMGRAAILLHDLFKYGLEGGEYTTNDHDRVAAEFLLENASLPGPVLGCVDSHNGAWCRGKSPSSNLEELHHLADMVASREPITGIGVLKPCVELCDAFPDLVVWVPDDR